MNTDLLLAINRCNEIDTMIICYILNHGAAGQAEIGKFYGKDRQNIYHRGKVLVSAGVLEYNDKKYALVDNWEDVLVKWKNTTSTECDSVDSR